MSVLSLHAETLRLEEQEIGSYVVYCLFLGYCMLVQTYIFSHR